MVVRLGVRLAVRLGVRPGEVDCIPQNFFKEYHYLRILSLNDGVVFAHAACVKLNPWFCAERGARKLKHMKCEFFIISDFSVLRP